MDPICFKVPRQTNQSVRAEFWELPSFYKPFHFHAECQLTLILRSQGVLYSVDGCLPYKTNDLFLLGKDYPHVFRRNSESQDVALYPAQAISVFFDYDQITKFLSIFPEGVRDLETFKHCNRGIKVSLSSDSPIIKFMNQLLDQVGMDQILTLVTLISQMSRESKVECISQQTLLMRDPLYKHKIETILDFINENHTRQVTLEDVASIINMSPSAFCRFFKRKTNKTFSNYLIEVRIATACRLLTQCDMTVSETCFESGYNSTSNFHRHFRRVTGISPIEYKRQILQVS